MKTIHRLRWGVATIGAAALVLVVNLTPVSAVAQEKSADAQLRQGMAACGRVKETTARLRCFDKLEKSNRQAVPSSGQPAADKGGAEPAKLSAEKPSRASPKEERPPRSQASSGATSASGAGRNSPHQITVHVAHTVTLPNGRLRIVATNGMIWDQTQGAPAEPLKPGSEVTISRNFLGGHWCQLNKWLVVRCRRADRPKKTVSQATKSASMQEVGSSTNQSKTGTRVPPATTLKSPRSAGSSKMPPASQEASPPPSDFGLQKQADEAEPSKVVVTVANAKLMLNGTLSIVTSDGSVWTQTQGPSVVDVPKPGAQITITRNLMGGHWCQLNKWTAVRCAKQTH